MKVVADKLKEIALAANTDHQVDQFGRSAFNRYYYAAYLAVRNVLMEIDVGWARSPHKSLPEILTVTVFQAAKRTAIRSNKKRLLSYAEMKKILSSIKICADELSKILQSGYEARRCADYSPEVNVKRILHNLRLGNHTIHEAQSWPERAEVRAGQLLSSWRQLG